jgi:hypothetical protein
MNAQEQLEDQVRAELQGLAREIKRSLPKGFGFVLLVTSCEPGAALLYVATLDRGDVLQMMREFIATNREERVWRAEMPEVELSEEFEEWWESQLKRKGMSCPRPEAFGSVESEKARWAYDQLLEWTRDAYNAGRASA